MHRTAGIVELVLARAAPLRLMPKTRRAPAVRERAAVVGWPGVGPVRSGQALRQVLDHAELVPPRLPPTARDDQTRGSAASSVIASRSVGIADTSTE